MEKLNSPDTVLMLMEEYPVEMDIYDDVLYVVRNGIGRDIYYLFHLTYSAHNVDGFPRYEEFADIFAVKEFIERSYIEDYM